MQMNELVNLICKLAETHGKSRDYTVNERFDATAAQSMDWDVWMQYGFGPPVKVGWCEEHGCVKVLGNSLCCECRNICKNLDQEPPDPEMIHVHITCIWGEGITVTSPSIKMNGYFDTAKEFNRETKKWESGLKCHRTEGCKEEELLKVLERLVWEGDWTGTDPSTIEPDPMGCLRDYE